MEPGVYRTNDSFGYLTPVGTFISCARRETARDFARADNVVTTTKGTYSVPKPGKRSRGNRKYYWGDFLPGKTIVVVSKEKYNSVLTAAILFKQKHNTFDFSVIKAGNTYTFLRVQPGEGERVGTRKQAIYAWDTLEINERTSDFAYPERMKVYHAMYSYMQNHPGIKIIMETSKAEGIAWFVRKA